MEEKVTRMRKLALIMAPNGTITPIESPGKVYKGSFGFLSLQLYVPLMPIVESEDVLAKCAVSANVVDEFGKVYAYKDTEYNMMYAGPTTVEGNPYHIYERAMPSAFTKIEGDITLVFSYSLINDECKSSRSCKNPTMST